MASNEDVAVQATAGDAAHCKAVVARLGYTRDEFAEFFSPDAGKRSPLIHRGYFARVAAVNSVVDEICGADGRAAENLQIIVLGAGMETLYFRLQRKGASPRAFVEIDFPEVVARKAAIIKRQEPLREALGPDASFATDPSAQPHARSGPYSLLSVDLRDEAAFVRALDECGLDAGKPTLVLLECVLVYMEEQHGTALLRRLASRFEDAACAVYDPIHPTDRFGKIMVSNLKRRGCDLRSIAAVPTLQAHHDRFLAAGWHVVRARDMLQLYNKELPREEKQRIECIEPLDELEEWNLILAHYAFVLAFTAPSPDAGLASRVSFLRGAEWPSSGAAE